MSTQQLKDKVALVTGGTTGIGLATAQLFAEEGARVIVTGRNPERVAQAQETLGSAVKVLQSDAADGESIKSLVKTIESQYGRLDVLFANAGVALFAPLEQLEESHFETLFNVNLKGPWLLLKHALPLLKQGTSVIVTTSVVHQRGMPGSSLYAATKAGLRAFVRVAAAELAPRGIRINAVSPGPVETPIFGKMGMPQEAMQEMAQGIVRQIPLQRFGKPEELAQAALFLASDRSSFVHGAELDVDGGMAQA